jgi:hypothetical protein
VSCEVICPRCGKKHTVQILSVLANVCPNGRGIYHADELELVRPEQKALYRPKRKAAKG